MFPFNLVRWLKSWNRARHGTCQKKPRFRLALEELETRLAPATHTWTGAGGNTLWSNVNNWALLSAPSMASPLDDVVFPASVPLASRTAQNDIPGLVLNSIQINASNYTLSNLAAADFVTLGSPSAAGSGTLFVSAGAVDTISMPLQLAGPNANQQFFTINAAASLTITGAISGTTGSQLTKEGTGTLFLNANNSGFLGPVTIPNGQGIVSASNANALGSPITSEMQAIALTGASAGSTTFTLTFNGVTTPNITYTGTPADAGTIQAALDGLSTIGGAGGSVTVTALGSVFTATFGGALANLNVAQLSGTIAAGAGSIATAITVPGGATTNVVTVGNNSQLQLNTVGAAITGATNASPIVITSAGNGLTTGQQVDIAGVGGNLAADGVWTITVINANSFSLNNSAGNAAFTAGGTWTLAFTNPLFVSGTGISNDGALLNVQGNNGWAGSVQMVTDATFGINAAVFPTPSVLTIAGVISDAGAGHNLTKTGADPLILSNANTYRGSTSITNGVLEIENPLALGANPAAGTFVNANAMAATQGTLQLTYTGGPTLPAANLQDYLLQNPALAYSAATNPYVGFLVPGEALYCYDAGFINGALDNVEGNNAWSGNIILEPLLVGGVLNAVNVNFSVDAYPGLGGTPTSLLVTGVISDDPTRPAAGAAIGKTGAGNLILEPTIPNSGGAFTPTVMIDGEPTNSITGVGTANTFGDKPTIFAGTITLEDSQGLGPTTKTLATGEFGNTSIHLQADVGHVDSVTGSTARLQIDDPISIEGTGVGVEGALDSVAGINTYVANPGVNGPVIILNNTAANTAIGVDADPNESNNANYLTNDYSLTITGGIGEALLPPVPTLTKVGAGNLILPNANPDFTSDTTIAAGWITLEDPDGLGPHLLGQNPALAQVGTGGQTTVTVDTGASLNLEPLVAGTSFTFFHNLALTGTGNLHAFSLISQQGALLNLAGDNTITGNIALVGAAAIGIVQVNSSAPSQLTLTGEITEPAPSSTLTKLGGDRLVLDGPGIYTGGTDIRQGVIQVANDTALGTPAAGDSTIVEAGAALEIVPTDPLTNGGEAVGPNIYSNPLVLNGSGNTAFGDAPLAIAPNIDTAWNGPITLNTNIYVGFQNALGNLPLATMTANTAGLTGTIPTLAVTTTTTGGVNPITGQTYSATQALTFGGTIIGGTFTLTFTNGPSDITAAIPWSSNASTLAFNVQKALAALANVPANSVAATPSAPDLDVAPDSRLSVTGAISDLNIPTNLVMNGGGELLLAGDDTYRGNTDVNEGTLTVANGAALGSGATSEVQTVTLAAGPVPNLTNFTLTFNGVATAVIPYTGTAADAATVQAALDELASIGGAAGSVAVTKAGSVFTITFGGNLAGFNQNQISAAITAGPGSITSATVTAGAGGTFVANHAAIQMEGGVTVSGVPLVIQGTGAGPQSAVQGLTLSGAETGTYTLSFNGQTTGPLTYYSTADQVQAALQGLSSVGGVGGIINVSQTGASGGVDETQQLNFSGIVAGVTQFKLTVTIGAASYTTGPIIATGTAVDQSAIQTALISVLTTNGLSGSFSVQQLGIGTPGGGFIAGDTIIFQDALADAPQPLITATVTAGAGTTTVTQITPGSGPSETFSFAFQGSFVGANVPALSATPSGGLSAVPAIIVVGGSANATPYQWQSIGPAPVSDSSVINGSATLQNGAGIITGVTIDKTDPTGNTIYISTAGGGAFKTTDGGATWTPLFDNEAATMWGGAIAYAPNNPQVVYFGTGTGNFGGFGFAGTGIYKSTNAGQTWTLVTDSAGANPLASETINKIIVDPGDPNQFWAAVTDQEANDIPGSAGIWRFNGTSWLNMTAASGLPSTDANYTDMALTNQAGAALTLYFALATLPTAAQNGVYIYLVPRGVAPALSAPTFPAGAYSSIKITAIAGVTQATDTLYASVADPATEGSSTGNGGVYVSVNGGATWSLTAGQPGEYLAPFGEFANAIIAKNAATVFVGGTEQGLGTSFVYETINGGAAGGWMDISGALGVGPGTFITSMSLSTNSAGDSILVVSTAAGVWEYNVFTSTWTDINGNLASSDMLGIATNPAGPNLAGGIPDAVGGTALGGAAVYTGASPAWEGVNIGNGDGGVTLYDPSNPLTVYEGLTGSLLGYNIAKSTDGGTTWAPTGFATASYYVPFAIDNVNTERLVAGGSGADTTLQQTLNGGTTWTSLFPFFGAPLLNVSALAISEYQGPFAADPRFPAVTDIGAGNYDANTIYATDGGTIVVTKNDGSTWATITSLTLQPGTTISDLEVDPRDRDTVYAVTSGDAPLAAEGRVFESTDAGQTWTDISAGLPDVPAWKLVIDPRSNNLYLGTDEGVWVLNGGAGTWARFGVGLPNVSVQALDLNQTTNILTAGTYGRSAFQISLDDGAMSAGVLRAVAGSDAWSGPIYLAAPTTISANGTQSLLNGVSAAELTIVGAIADQTPGADYPVTKIGEGDVILSGTNTFGGTVEVAQGNLVVHNPDALGSAFTSEVQTVTIGGAAVGTFSLTFNGQTTPFLLANVTPLQLATALDNLSSIGGVLGFVDVNEPSPGVFTVAFAGSLMGQSPLALPVMTSTAAGGATVATAITTNGSTFGTAGTTVDNGAALELETSVDGEPITLNGNGIQPAYNGYNSGALVSVSNNNTYTGTLTLNTDSTIGVDSGSLLTISGSITDGANDFSVDKEGPGTLVLSGADSYHGDTNIDQGVLSIQSNLGLGIPGATVNVFDGAQLQIQGGITVTGDLLNLSGSGIFGTGALLNVGGINTWAGNIVLGSFPYLLVPSGAPATVPATTVVMGITTGNLTIDGAISETGGSYSLTEVGTGRLILQQADAYSGLTTISAGATLNVEDSKALSGNQTDVVSGATLEIQANTAGGHVDSVTGTANVSINEPLFVNGAGVNGAGAIHNVGSAVQTITLTNPVAGGFNPTQFTLTFNGSTTAPITYTGVAAIDAANIMSALNALLSILGVGGSVSVTSPGGNVFTVVFGGNLSPVAVALISGSIVNPTPGSIASAVITTGGPSDNAITGAVTLQSNSTINADANTHLTITGVVADPAPAPIPPANLTKIGAGTVILTGANTYTGVTNINAGIVNIQNSQALGLNTTEVQTVTISGSGGTFSLNFGGQVAGPFIVGASAAQVQAGLNALSNISAGGGFVTVTAAGNVFTITFNGGPLANTNQPPISATVTGGAGAVTATLLDGGQGGTIVAAGATLQVQSNGVPVVENTEALTLSGNGASNAGLNLGALNNVTGNNSWNGPIVLAANTSIGADGSAGTLTLTQPISGNFSLTKVGLGVVQDQATAANTYTGSTTVLLGVLRLDDTNNVTAVPSNAVTIGAPGSNQFLRFTGFLGGNKYQLVFNGTPTATLIYTGNPVADAAAIQAALSVLVGVGNTVAVSPDYQNDFLVIFGGGLAATLVTPLTANILTGTGLVATSGPTVAAFLQESTINQIANTATLTVFNDAQYSLNGAATQTIGALNMTGGAATLAAASVLTLAGNVTATSNALGDATISGAGTVSEGGVARTFTVNAGTQPSDLVISTVITGTAGAGLNKAGSGRLELNAVEGYTGPTTISAGDVQIDAAASIQNVILNGGSLSGRGAVAAITGPAAGAAVGTIDPGINSTVPVVTGVLDTGSITAGQPTIIDVDLNHVSLTAPVAGVDYDQINVTGNVNLGAAPGALLTGTSSLSVQLGDTFTILQATGTLTGFLSRFVGAVQTSIPNNGSVFLSGQKFLVQYTTNSVILTRELSTATVTITAAPGAASVYGQDVVFTATVVPEVGAALPAAGGEVTFTFDANTVNALTQTVPVVGGVATFDPQTFGNFTWPLGTHTIDATFTDTNNPTSFTQAQASTLVQTVNRGATSVAVISASPSVTPVYGQPVTITAAVAPTITPTTNGSIFPTGTVTFTVDPGPGQLNFPGIILSGTQASIALPGTLAVGVHHVHVVYNGDTNYANSVIASDFVVTVVPDSAIVTVTASPASPALLGQPVTFSAAVSAALPGSPGLPTGTVNFYDGPAVPANLLNASPITMSAGTATFTDASLTVNVYTITAVYSGDTNYLTNTGTLSYTVGLVTTATSLISAPTTATFGQSVTLTATVVPGLLGFGTPTGTVVFFDSTTSTTLGTGTLNASGVAVLTTAVLTTANHVLTATYSGDPNFTTSIGTIGNFQVNPATTSTSLTAVPGGADVFGESVTFTATVGVTSPGAPGTPTGTVTFTDATTNTPLGTMTLNASGQAALTTSVLTVNTHTITAVYNGALNFTASNGVLSGYVVAGDSSSVTVTAAPASSVYGQAVAFTASIVGAAPGMGLPVDGGVVLFYDGPVGSTLLGAAPLSGGQATFNYSGLTAAAHNISAAFAGDTNLAAGNGTLANFLVTPTNTTVTVSAAPPGGVNFGNTASFSAIVTATLPGVGTPADGDLVTFKDGATTLGTATLTGGIATFSTSSLNAGPHVISATFDGDANFAIGTGTLAPAYNVGLASTGTTVAVSPTSSDVFGQAVSLTAVVSNSSGGAPGVPGGTVSFWDGPVGIGTLLGTRTLTGGQATLVTTALSVNSGPGHTINASYSGNAFFAGSAGALTNYLVAQDGTTTTVATLQANPALGQPVQFTATIAGIAPGSGAPSDGDLVTFKDNGVIIGLGTLTGGVATFTDNNLTLGAHTITAFFAGDLSYLGSTGTLANYTVAPSGSTTIVSASPTSPTVFGQLVTISASVSAVSPGTGVPANGDTVTFYDGAAVPGNLIGVGTLISGVASVNTSSLVVGTHTLTAVFSGDADYDTSTGMLANYAITQVGTQTFLAPLSNVVYGQPAVFTATVTATSGVGIPTSGTITYYDAGVSVGTATLSGSNTAVFTTTTALALGTHTITAVYNGGGNFLVSPVSNTQILSVGQAGSSMTLTESAPAVALGQPVTFTATVTPLAPSSAAITSGTVLFKDGAVTIGTVTLSGSNVATLPISTLASGVHQISASYVSTANYTGSTSSLLTESILNVATITPTPTPAAPLFGQATTLTVGITGSGAAPTGTVTVLDNTTSTTLASNVAFASAIDIGDGTVLHPFLAAGIHSLTIQYSGDANYAPGTKTISLTVGADVTATTLTASAPTPAVYGEPLTFTAVVGVTSPAGGAVPTSGVVTFKDGGATLGTVTLSGSNVATYSTAILGVATHAITASYGGSADDASSTGTLASYVVKAAATTTVVSGAPSPSSFGQAVTFSATVTASGPSAATVTSGIVTFKDGATTLGTGAVTNGVATFTTSTLTAATHSITAAYAATTDFAASTSPVFSHVVSQAGTTTSLTSSLPAGSAFGQAVTFKATVTNSAGGTNPTTGSVVFKDGAATLGTVALSNSNVATFNLATLGVATSPHSITASFVGTTTYAGSTSNTVVQTVSQASTTVALSSTPVNWALGQAVTFTANVTSPSGGVPTGAASGVIFTITGPNGTVTPTATSFTNGKATLSYTFPNTAGSAGAYSVSVTYAGNANFAGSAAGPVTQADVRKASTITLATSNASPGHGAAITFTATVAGLAGPPTGTVSFFDGSTFLGTGVVVNGKAKLTISTLAIGTHKITATYGGDQNFNSSIVANALTQNVTNKAVGRLV